MSDPPDNDTSGSSAKPDSRPTRSFDASVRLSRLLSRPLGAPPPPGEPPAAPAEPSAPPTAPPVAPPPRESEPGEQQAPPRDETADSVKPAESVAAEPPVEIPAAPAAAAEQAVPLSAAPREPPPVSPPPGRVPPPAGAEEPSDAGAERHLGKIRRLMLVANLFMFIAVAAVLGVIGFRVFHSGDTAAPAKAPPPPTEPAPPPLDMTLTLPRGAKVVQTGIADDRLVITIEVDGAWEVRTFDVKTLKPAGRMTFTTVP